MSRLPVAWLRMCSSSPWCRPCAASLKISIGPDVVDEAAHERAEVVAEEAQALDRLVGVGAEPQRLAGALVERREGARAGALVLDDPDRHRRRADAGHRADVVVLVARARGRSRPSSIISRARSRSARPALEQAWPRRARGAAGRQPVRLDRRAGVDQRAALGEHRQDVARGGDADRARRARLHPLDDLLVGLRDRRAVRAPQALERARRPRGRRDAGGRQSTSTTGVSWSRIASPNAASPTLTTSTLCSTA